VIETLALYPCSVANPALASHRASHATLKNAPSTAPSHRGAPGACVARAAAVAARPVLVLSCAVMHSVVPCVLDSYPRTMYATHRIARLTVWLASGQHGDSAMKIAAQAFRKEPVL